MKILMVHNYYQRQGGEDISFNAEAELLESFGHQVLRYTRNNDEISDYSSIQKILLARNTIWSSSSYKDIEAILHSEKPDIAHFQNTFPLISPSAFYACKKFSIPVVVSLRNYRLLCLNGLFLKNNQICEDCIGITPPLPGIVHACYRESHLQSTIVASMLTYHRMLNTWDKKIDAYITPSEFSRSKFIQGGLPDEKINVKPNFAMDAGAKEDLGNYAVFIGRLSQEKGVEILLEAIARNSSIRLVILGDGPLIDKVTKFSENRSNITCLGQFDHARALDVMKSARFIIYPTIVYETFGRSIIEAFACGVPVIASRIGTITELIRDNETGLLVNPGDIDDLVQKMDWLWTHSAKCKQMGKEARQEYLNKYTPEKNYPALMKIYQSVL